MPLGGHSISARDLFFGAIGTVVGGLLVWSLTKNLELSAQLKALETVNPQVLEAVALSSKAEVSSSEAINRATEAIKHVKEAEAEANKIITTINATPLFKNIDQSIGELRSLAKQTATKSAEEAISKIEREMKSVSMDKTANMMCGVINNAWDYGRAYKISSDNTCNNICAASSEDTKQCAGFLSYDENTGRFGRQECDQAVGKQYFASQFHNYCCCK